MGPGFLPAQSSLVVINIVFATERWGATAPLSASGNRTRTSLAESRTTRLISFKLVHMGSRRYRYSSNQEQPTKQGRFDPIGSLFAKFCFVMAKRKSKKLRSGVNSLTD